MSCLGSLPGPSLRLFLTEPSVPVFLASIRCFKPPYGACSSDSQGCSAQLTGLKYFPALKAQPNNTFSIKPLHPRSRVSPQHRQRGWTHSELWLQSGSTWSVAACQYPYIPSQPASHSQVQSISLPTSVNTTLHSRVLNSWSEAAKGGKAPTKHKPAGPLQEWGKDCIFEEAKLFELQHSRERIQIKMFLGAWGDSSVRS